MTTDLAPYAGRWVAMAGELVAGVGYTANEALHLAQHNRPREHLRLHYVEKAEGKTLNLPPLLDELLPILSGQPMPIYLVGGAVRDALLDGMSRDLDFVVPHHAISLAYKVADHLKAPAYVLDEERDTGRVVVSEGETTLDFARLRGKDLDEDLCHRDFTINAMALPATARRTSSIIDPCGGRDDLANQLIRLTHTQAITDDPVRALRALRLALYLDFEIAPDTANSLPEGGALFETVSAERIRDELLKLLRFDAPDQAIGLLDRFKLLEVTLPEVAALHSVTQSPPHHEPVLAHTVATLRWCAKIESAIVSKRAASFPLDGFRSSFSIYAERLSHHLEREVEGGLDGRTLLRLGVLFHDVGKRATREESGDGRIRFLEHETVGARMATGRLRQLALSNKAIAHVRQVVAGHMRPLWLVGNLLVPGSGAISRRAIYRFFRDTGTAGIDICLLALADHLATHRGPGPEKQWRALTRLVAELFYHYFEQYTDTVAPSPLLNGHELMQALQIEPGPEVGRLLRKIEEAQASGDVESREAAIRLARQLHQ